MFLFNVSNNQPIMSQELCQCYQKSLEEKTEGSLEENTEGDEPFWPDVVTDLILSLLPSASSSVVKQLVIGYRSIAPLVTEDSIEVIVDNLLRTNNQDEEMETDEEEENEEEENEEEEDGDEDEEEPTEIEKFRAKLSSILGPDVDDDEHVADDEEMLKLDEALSEAFREKLGKNKKIRELKLSDDFKCRVLSVYTTILKRRQIPVNFFLPLLPIFINLSKKSSMLAEKSASVLGEVSSIPASKIYTDGLVADVTDTLDTVVSESFEICCDPKSEKKQQIMAQLIIWTSKLAKAHGWTIPKFREGLIEYFKKSISKSHKFNHSFFQGLVERDESVASFLQEPLSHSILDDSIKVGNRALACQVLNLALKRGTTFEKSKELLDKCSNHVTKMLNGDKLNILVLAGLINIIDTLKSHKNYQLEVSPELIISLKTITKKTKLKMPKSGQNSLKDLLKGTGEPNAGMKVNKEKKVKKVDGKEVKENKVEGKKVGTNRAENKNGGVKRKTIPSKGDDKSKKKLIKK